MGMNPPLRPPPRYAAAPGREDRHGEMTGAITFNMIFVYVPATVWCVFIAPMFLPLWATLVTGLVLVVVLTIIGVPLSRRRWAQLSAWMDRVNESR